MFEYFKRFSEAIRGPENRMGPSTLFEGPKLFELRMPALKVSCLKFCVSDSVFFNLNASLACESNSINNRSCQTASRGIPFSQNGTGSALPATHNALRGNDAQKAAMTDMEVLHGFYLLEVVTSIRVMEKSSEVAQVGSFIP